MFHEWRRTSYDCSDGIVDPGDREQLWKLLMTVMAALIHIR
jgi:hypothetical protein